ncbi:MAG: glycosyltransferase family 2 protein [bacterium]|nr:glycosyltransferase family 2 protein [bacterium]
MVDIEIPLAKDRDKRYRFFEILPGALSWTILIGPFILAWFYPVVLVVFILTYFLIWFSRAIGLNVRSIQGYREMQRHMKYDWTRMLEEIDHPEIEPKTTRFPKWHYRLIDRLQANPTPIKPSEIIHAVIIAVYNESKEIIEPTIQGILDSNFDSKKVIMYIAYEERGGEETEKTVKDLIKKYEDKVMFAKAVKHPTDIPNEVQGKGPNITFTGKVMLEDIKNKNLPIDKIMVTTLDSDNIPHPNYLPALTYTVCATPDPHRVSYQPIPIYTNNIWDAPAPMRVIATGNSFWMVVQSLRQHVLRNFASHAQSLHALTETDFWSTRTIVEDGHQFWRSYFRFDGNYEVFPIFVPVYQDAVLAGNFKKTVIVQFKQLRRWAYGASDVSYFAQKAFMSDSKAPLYDRIFKFARLLEGHVSWATAPLILIGAAFVPILVSPDNFAANQLPLIASNIQRIALSGILVTLFLSVKVLPPKPERYKHHRTFFMLIQWVLLPFTTIFFNSFAAINSQTHLIFGKYLDVFEHTTKVKK